jgi:hypothetical protein
MSEGGQCSHEHDQEDVDEQCPHLFSKFTSLSCRLFHGDT